MKAKELIELLKLYPESDVSLSTVIYKQSNPCEAGYERDVPQKVTGVRLVLKDESLIIEGGEECRFIS